MKAAGGDTLLDAKEELIQAIYTYAWEEGGRENIARSWQCVIDAIELVVARAQEEVPR